MTSPDAPDADLTCEEREQIERAGERLARELVGVFDPVLLGSLTSTNVGGSR